VQKQVLVFPSLVSRKCLHRSVFLRQSLQLWVEWGCSVTSNKLAMHVIGTKWRAS
jgi:hypothetical protein